MPVAQKTPQAVGSAITYAKRYALAAIAGIATDDDDGEGAEGRDAHKPAAPARRPQQQQQQAKPAAKAAEKPDALADDAAFVAILNDQLKNNGFNDRDIAAIRAGAKIEDFVELSVDRRRKLIDAIVNGTLRPKSAKAA